MSSQNYCENNHQMYYIIINYEYFKPNYLILLITNTTAMIIFSVLK
jgi:hypothetical protein